MAEFEKGECDEPMTDHLGPMGRWEETTRMESVRGAELPAEERFFFREDGSAV